jgi:hypothetical protein
MPSISINYTINQGKIITKIAAIQGKTPKEYIENLIANHCDGQIRGYFMDKIKNKSTADLISLLGDIE